MAVQQPLQVLPFARQQLQLLQLQHSIDDAASSNIHAGDGFDAASPSLIDPGRGDDSDDELYSCITRDDMTLLRAITAAAARRASRAKYECSSPDTLHQVSSLPKLPKGTKPVRLVGEGAANAVFEIKVPPGSRASTHFKGKLLRVAKVPAIGRVPTSNYLNQQHFFHRDIEPRLADHAVRQELVVLCTSTIVDDLNAILQAIDHVRKPKFRGTFIGQAAWGFLVDDMRPDEAGKSVLVEFKPKWLLQSPSAPQNAIRCRQCAVELRNYLHNPGSKQPFPQGKPCPLTLGNPDSSPSQVSSPFRIAPQLAGVGTDSHFAAALDKIVNHDAIEVLRTQQKLLDQVGPLNADPSDPNFAIAMTLRDCTCFALIPVDKTAPIEIRLGDFDWKDPQVKFAHWRGTEQGLIDDGFYTADWIVCDGVYYHPPSLCLLEWTSGKRTAKPEILLMQDKNSATKTTTIASLQSKTLTVYTHKTDVEALQKGLETFRKEPAGTPPDAVYNPCRSDPT